MAFVTLGGFIPLVLIGFLASLMAAAVVLVTFVVVRARRAPDKECKWEKPRGARDL